MTDKSRWGGRHETTLTGERGEGGEEQRVEEDGIMEKMERQKRGRGIEEKMERQRGEEE